LLIRTGISRIKGWTIKLWAFRFRWRSIGVYRKFCLQQSRRRSWEVAFTRK